MKSATAAALAAIVILLATSVGGYLLLGSHHHGLPTMPDLMKRAGESQPSAEFLKAEAGVKEYRTRIETHPDELQNYVVLAGLYLEESRVTANHSFYLPVAEQIIDAALDRNANYFDAMVVKAGIYMTKHRFAEAKGLVTQAIAINPDNSGAYGVLCDANVELGHYDEAVKACDKMIATRPDLRSYARASYLRQIHGDDTGAASAMALAADAGAFGAENREWALYQLGMLYFNQGKLDTAKFIFNGILEERPNYGYALSGRAAVEATRADYPHAIEDLVQATQVQPEHLFLEQLSDVYLAMGDSTTSRELEEKVLASYDQHAKDGWNVDREYAGYCLNHGIHASEALARAEREYQARPGNIDVLDTYTWALFANGRANEALPLISRTLRLRTRYPWLHYHAGMIYAACGMPVMARSELQSTLTEDPYVTLLTAQTARNKLAELSAPLHNE